MAVYQEGTVNLAALVVDDIYVVVARPASTSVQGVETGVAGVVGGASWGPLDTPVLLGSPSEVAANFGPLVDAPNDMPTDALILMQQGVTKVVGVRVSDGTDAKAIGNITTPGTAASGTVTIAGVVHSGDVVTVTLNGTAVVYTTVVGDATTDAIATKVKLALEANVGLAAVYSFSVAGSVVTITAKTAGVAANSDTLTVAVTGASATVTATASGATLAGGAAGTVIASLEALYSGSEGNNVSYVMTPGANSTATAPTWTLRVSRQGAYPQAEVFANLPEASLGTSIVNALANGLSVQRGPSDLVRATVGATPAVAPSQVAAKLSGGANGDLAITTAKLIGSNAVVPATGMYALEGQGVQQFELCGNTDSAGWALQVAFALSMGALPVMGFPANTSTASAIAAKKAAGIDTPYAYMVKDWVQFYDTYNAKLRLVSPAAFALGRIASLSPQHSPGNKPIVGIQATERTLAKQPYQTAELGQLFQAGIAVITNQNPGGSFFGLRHGLNASSDATINGVEYTRMTNFLAYSFNQSFGKFIERVQTVAADDPLREEARVSLNNFLAGLMKPDNKMIDEASVDMSFGPGKVNSKELVTAGYMNAVVRVRYLSIVRFFVVSLIGGKTVEVQVK